MKGHHELKDHPFFSDIDFLSLKQQRIPVPAYEIKRDIKNQNMISSFSLYDPAEEY